MVRYVVLSLALAGLLPVLSGCGGGNSLPSAPSAEKPFGTTANPAGLVSSGGNMLWGMWDVAVDVEKGTVEAVPLRGAMFNANVTKFLQPPLSPINMLSMTMNPGSIIQAGYLDLDVTLRHPFFSFPKLRGFDVRGIVMGDGAVAFSWDTSAKHYAPGDLELLNADGYTRWWNPTEFTTYGTILGYTKGIFATPDYQASATVNPYKYFTDGLDKDASVADLDIQSRGTFGVDPGINKRRYLLQFPVLPGGGPVYHFNYAIDASWALPSDAYAPEYPVEAYPPEANMQEAWLASVSDSESTAWWVDEGNNGGSLKLAIEIYDWQSAYGSTVADEVSAIWVESAVIKGPKEITAISLAQPAGPVSSVWNAEISDLNLTASGTFECWVGVVSSDPSTYEPQIEGDPSMFDWPDAALTAYFLGNVHVLGTNPSMPPEVLKVNPPVGVVSTVLTDVQIIGNWFADGATVEFEYESGEMLAVSNTVWQNGNLITCDLDCSGPLGFYDVTVTNPDLQFDTLADGFEVLEEWKCEGDAHDWAGLEYNLAGIPYDPYFNRLDMAILKKGSQAGMALYQMTSGSWGVFDPDGGAGQTVQSFMTTTSMYPMEIETCETSGRIAIVSFFDPKTVMLYDEEGDHLGDFVDPNLDPSKGCVTALDFDKYGDMWVVTKTRTGDWTGDYEIRHYALLEESPYYEPVPEDTVLINDSAMTGPVDAQGVGDLGMCFYLNRLFVFTANTADGGSNKLTTWDLDQSPPVLVAERQDPYPPLTRHHIFGNTGSLNRMNIDADHRFADDKEEQCRIYAYATIWTWGPPAYGVDCCVIRLDADLNTLDEGSIYHPAYPGEFDKVPQCCIINDYGPTSSANLVGHDFPTNSFLDWPVPSTW